jgi:hypothetical protein
MIYGGKADTHLRVIVQQQGKFLEVKHLPELQDTFPFNQTPKQYTRREGSPNHHASE